MYIITFIGGTSGSKAASRISFSKLIIFGPLRFLVIFGLLKISLMQANMVKIHSYSGSSSSSLESSA
jgi:hypothetical protein